MNDTKTKPALEIRRTFKAPRARVFDAWTKPEMVREWFGPAGFSIPEIAMDVREGGQYRIAMLDSEDGERVVVVGKFTKVRPPEQLAYTWFWENGDAETWSAGGETFVSIEFLERGDETEIVFKHEGFATVESRDGHNKGWGSTFDKLATFLSRYP